MRRLIGSTGMVALILGAVAGARAQDAARAIVERAVRAHGGQERLAKNRADRVRFKGTLYLRGQSVPFTADTLVQMPAQYKTLIEMRDEGGKHTLVHVMNGDKVYVTVDSQPQRVDAAALAEMRTTMELHRARRLVPLLTDRAYNLAVLEEEKVNDRPALGVRVTARGRKELRLFFDKELGLLVKAEHLLDDGGGRTVRQVQFFGDYKDFDGCKQPARVMAIRDGKKVMEAELIDVKYFEKIDEAAFDKP